MKKSKISSDKSNKKMVAPYVVKNDIVTVNKIKKTKKSKLKKLEKEWDQSFINNKLPVRIVTHDKPTQYKNLETQFRNRYNHDHNFQLTKQKIIKEGDKIAGKVQHWVPEEQWNPSFINHKLYIRPIIFEKQPQKIPYVTQQYGYKFYSVDQKLYKPRSESTHEKPPEYANPILQSHLSDDEGDMMQYKLQNNIYRQEEHQQYNDNQQENYLQQQQDQNQQQQEQQNQQLQQQQNQEEEQKQNKENESSDGDDGKLFSQQKVEDVRKSNVQVEKEKEEEENQQQQIKQNQDEIEKKQEQELENERKLQQEILEQEQKIQQQNQQDKQENQEQKEEEK